MKLSCAVIDDEPLAVELMESYVRKTPFLELYRSFGSADAAFGTLRDHPVDLLFCDIQMPGLNGMELARLLPPETSVIFTTAYSHYAVEGFRVHATDYLLKPIDYADFLAAAERALRLSELNGRTGGPSSHAQAAGISPRGIFVRTEHRLQRIELDSILYIEGLKDYVKIHVEGADAPVLSLMSMKSLEEMLPEGEFMRVHRSYIVHTSKIRVIERNRIVFGSVYIPISDTARQPLFDCLSSRSIMPDA